MNTSTPQSKTAAPHDRVIKVPPRHSVAALNRRMSNANGHLIVSMNRHHVHLNSGHHGTPSAPPLPSGVRQMRSTARTTVHAELHRESSDRSPWKSLTVRYRTFTKPQYAGARNSGKFPAGRSAFGLRTLARAALGASRREAPRPEGTGLEWFECADDSNCTAVYQ